MKQNFFDQLDGGWGDLIADTYKKTNEPLLVFPIDGHQLIDSFFGATYKDKTIEGYQAPLRAVVIAKV